MDIERLLQISALVLSIINGLMLLFVYFRDRPILQVEPIHPDQYQWWFRLPAYTHDGITYKRYGFLTYVGISNKGFRKVSMNSWRLIIRTIKNKKYELVARSIPEPQFKFTLADGSEYSKVLRVLGTTGIYHTGDTDIDSGCSIAGVAYYILEFDGNSGDDIRIDKTEVEVRFIAKGVYGRNSKVKIVFHEKDFEFIKSIIAGVEAIY